MAKEVNPLKPDIGAYKEQRTFSALSNAGYAIACLWREDTALALITLLGTMMRIAAPFMEIVVPKIVIDAITDGSSPVRFLWIMGIMAGVLVIVHFIKGWTDRAIDENISMTITAWFTKKSAEKLLSMDYETKETAFFTRCFYRSWMHAGGPQGSDHYVKNISNMAVYLGGIFLFGGTIVVIHPLILVLLVFGAVVNIVMLTWVFRFNKDRWEKHAFWRVNQLMQYIIAIYGSKQNAKDIRIFNLLPWINKRFERTLDTVRASETTFYIRWLITRLTNDFLRLVRDGAAYAYLTYLLLQNRIGLGDFVMVFAVIRGLNQWITEAVSQVNQLMEGSLELSYRRDLLSFPAFSDLSPVESSASESSPDADNQAIPLPAPDKGLTLTLEDVGYAYPHYEQLGEGVLVIKEPVPVLEHINATIKAGERIAIVGINGAGKTTLVKLLCGLYRPTTGRILLNGQDIRAYNRDDYFSLITAVFQDIHLLPESIIENVSQQPADKTDRQRAMACLKKAGLSEVFALPQGVDTLLVREVHEEATAFSGGQQQKLALARALYKDAPLLILDEPTAALDPIAENDIYRQYADMTQGKTSVFISHRLASTRFCDRILFMENKTIAEEGAHDELIRRGGKYATMYAVQASYYTDKATEKDAEKNAENDAENDTEKDANMHRVIDRVKGALYRG